jgi:hypothetical protein
VFPDLWDLAEELVRDGRLFAPREVFREIHPGDGIKDWVSRRKSMFIDPDADQGAVLREIQQKFPNIDKPSKPGPCADPWLIALTLVRTRADPTSQVYVITEETLRGPGSVKIPNVCKHYGIPYAKVPGIFATEGVVFKATKPP